MPRKRPAARGTESGQEKYAPRLGENSVPMTEHSHGTMISHHRERGWSLEAALARLGRPGRSRAEDPRALWKRIGVPRGATVVDVGCGIGFYAIPAARRVGPTGRVWALDISSEIVTWLARQAKRLGLSQLVVRRSTPGRLPVRSHSADYLLLANLLHGLGGPRSPTLREVARIVRPAGQLINVDWVRRRTDEGPPYEIRLSPTGARRLLADFGFAHRETWEFGPTHYAQRFERIPSVGRQSD